MSLFRKIKTILFFVFVSAIIAGLFAYSVLGNDLPIEGLRAYIESTKFALPIFILLYAGLSMFIPTTPMMAVSGILFGFWKGILYTIIAGCTGSFITFYIARILGREFVDNILEHKQALELLEKYDEKIAKRGMLTVITLRAMPIMPTNVLNLIMGISKVGFVDFAIGSVIGFIPSHILAATFGTLIFTETFREISFYLATALLLTALFLLFKTIRSQRN